jgi:hypothetical protein
MVATGALHDGSSASVAAHGSDSDSAVSVEDSETQGGLAAVPWEAVPSHDDFVSVVRSIFNFFRPICFQRLL